MSKGQRKRPQTSKARNEQLMRAMQDKRKGNAAQPHLNKKKYNRRTDNWKQDI